MKKELFVVVGRSGEYEDLREWNVFAFETEKEAKEHAALAASEARRIELEEQEWRESDRLSKDVNEKNKYDPFMQFDYYSPPQYRVEPLTLLSSAKQKSKNGRN